MGQLADNEKRTLEGFIDSHSLADVLEAIETICYDKAQHVKENWQDSALGEIWSYGAGEILKANSKLCDFSEVFVR